MPHLFEIAFSKAMTALRAAPPYGETGGNLALAAGVYIGWDTDSGQVRMDTRPDPEGILHLNAQVAKPPEWMSFNIELGEGCLEPGDILGLVADVQADAPIDLAPFLRTSRDGALQDTPLLEHISCDTTRRVRTLMHPTHAGQILTGADGYHTLVIPLPPQDIVLGLFGMRLFVTPAARGFAVHDPVIGQT